MDVHSLKMAFTCYADNLQYGKGAKEDADLYLWTAARRLGMAPWAQGETVDQEKKRDIKYH